ncbi:MAG TPA: hypothetical protein VFW33_16590 [Gemmataceae bacterium]|nr:hypothetical protein [Gemmataceae bacterium]
MTGSRPRVRFAPGPAYRRREEVMLYLVTMLLLMAVLFVLGGTRALV